ncbi:MAG: Maf-like protein [Leptolyngbya sp. PLA2]|nr:Maf-like protein [Leptolyngbya sp. PL-A2]MCQ3940390.1 septum formation inhibitor Maf [cyanobacterium CYA1]MDL1904240.1 septum formation inhibitor Maf [Synechococcales cyanobacterium CNB]GIK19471.1 MAG: Maf-like protein [Planctomycetota bacterium]
MTNCSATARFSINRAQRGRYTHAMAGASTNAPVRPATLPRLILASSSPRRRELLARHGVAHEAVDPAIDDALLSPGSVPPHAWVASLAYLKAASVAASLDAADAADAAVILAADTLCFKDGELLGQPRDEADAERIIRMLQGGSHRVLTGVALVCPRTGRRDLFTDPATVSLGIVGDDRIAGYIASGGWRGKAGAYNYAERLADGWPLSCDGDPESVMGLPVRRVLQRLETFARSAA